MAIILGIESSCDDTSAAIIKDGVIGSNVVANQTVHEQYGGVVPELASRAHQQNIIPVVDQAIKRANISKKDISAIAFTRGPGLLGSLLVGTSFAKGFSTALDIPLIDVNHLQAHVLAHFIKEDANDDSQPAFQPCKKQSSSKRKAYACKQANYQGKAAFLPFRGGDKAGQK